MNIDQARINMISQQLRTWNVMDERALHLMEQIHREQFVPEEYKNLAYSDTEIPVGEGQSMMTPREEGHVLQALQIQGNDKVLQIGAIGGYLAALIAKQASHLYLVDPYQTLLKNAEQQISALGLTNISYVQGDINTGWESDGPFDVIVLTGSVPAIPKNIKNALSSGGRLYAVVGNAPAMAATLLHHKNDGIWQETKLFETDRARLPHAKELERFTF